MVDNNNWTFEPTLRKRKEIKFYHFTILGVLFIMLGLSSDKILNYINENKKTDDVLKKVEEIAKVEDKTVDNYLDNDPLKKEYDIDFRNLKSINSDIVGYLKVPGTNISQTVVKGVNNDYYLHHNFYKEYDVAGWIFADFEDKMDGSDKNIVIYGHNMKTGTMFGSLKNVLTDEWRKDEDNKYITFVTENETILYEIFSIYIVESEDYYRKVKFYGSEFGEFIKTIKSRSIYSFDVDVNEDDKILTLSTCHTNNKFRVVVHAKKAFV